MVAHGHAREDDAVRRVDLVHERLDARPMIDEEVPATERVAGPAGIARPAHGIHEIAGRVGDEVLHEFDFGNRRTVEMPDAPGVKRLDDERVVVGLHGVQYTPREAGDKMPCGLAIDLRIDAINRVSWLARAQ